MTTPTTTVPTEPTEAMLAAMRDAFVERTSLGALRAYRAMIAAAPVPSSHGNAWRPIESAPDDGTKFDGWQRDERVTDMYWSDIQDAWCVDGDYGPEEPTPLAIYPPVTHWMPLPVAPSEGVEP